MDFSRQLIPSLQYEKVIYTAVLGLNPTLVWWHDCTYTVLWAGSNFWRCPLNWEWT